ncbi:prepilin peptidase [Rhizomonospora bruguierae]|uniref:prepilin peptidase n=1 Tax=Rhizomonospora bruguierae TaxID=1581705 RepID=UPI001BD0E066|nr:A24 family peptidase [Micromonospora sp. NBRC 107566]
MTVAWLAVVGAAIGVGGRLVATRYGARPPWLVTAAVGAAVFALVGTHPRVLDPAVLWVAAFGVCLGFVDAAVHRLPDPLTLPAFAGAVALLAVRGNALPALLGAAGFAGGYLVLVLVRPGGMGLGDAKLALSLGAVLGPHGAGAVVAGAVAGLILAGGHAVVLLLLRRATAATRLPHGPFMLLGALAALLATTG